MKLIEIDASQLNSAVDFYDVILSELGAPKWHGKNGNALIDSLIYGGVNKESPPILINVVNTKKADAKVLEEIKKIKESIDRHREYYSSINGKDHGINMNLL